MFAQRLCVFGVLMYLLAAVALDIAQAQSPCNVIQSGAAAPSGFGVAWNPHTTARELLVSVTCTGASATLHAGSGNQLQYIYNQAYVWNGTTWQMLSLSGSNLVGGVWLIGNASGAIPQANVTPNQNSYVVAYLCTWVTSSGTGVWKCGCADSACATPLWQLQVFKPTQTTTGNTTSQTSGNTTAGTTGNTTGNTTGQTTGQTTGNTTGTTQGWWNTAMQYRVPVTVHTANYARVDKPVEKELNLATLLSQAGGSGTPDMNSVRVVEVTQAGALQDENTLYQFTTTSGTNGLLTIILDGQTAAGTQRYFHVYFNATGNTAPSQAVTELVKTTANTTDEGHDAIKFETVAGTYFFDKKGAGFSSMIDKQGNDWIAYKQGGDGAGTWWRGIPAFLPINIGNGGLFHPGFPSGATQLVFAGPVHARMKVTSSNEGGWEAYWDMYPTFAKISLTKAGNGVFSIICECAPGGQLELARDYYVRPDGTKTYASSEWKQDIPGEGGIEWAYLGDDNLNRVMYMTHNDDTKTDSGYSLNGDGGLFVLAFGRDKLTRTMTGGPQTAIFGFAETKTHASVKSLAFSAAQDATVTVGTARAK